MSTIFDRTLFELGLEQGPRQHGKLHRLANAVAAAGAADTPDDAHALMSRAADELGGATANGPTVREVLTYAGADVAAVGPLLARLEREALERRQEIEEDQWRRAVGVVDALRRSRAETLR